MEFAQKKLSTRIRYVFKEDYMEYSIKDKAIDASFNVDYHDVHSNTAEYTEKNDWYQKIGIFWILIGVLQTGYTFNQYGKVSLSIWLLIGGMCLVYYYLTQAKYTVFDSESGQLLVLHDKNHDAIVDKIKSHRRETLLARLGTIDFQNHPENEIGKYKWMVRNDVISEEEFKEKEKQIIDGHKEFNRPGEGSVDWDNME